MDYLHYFGIDVSKKWFDVSVYGDKKSLKRFDNDASGYALMRVHYGDKFLSSFVVLEATGGYELGLLDYFVEHKICVHRLNGLMSRKYSDSLGKFAKTDAIDAANLARYAFERHDESRCYTSANIEARELANLVARRSDLVAMRAMETNRKQQAGYDNLQESVDALLRAIAAELVVIEEKIAKKIANDDELSTKSIVLTEIKGLGKTTISVLLAHLPELGSLSRRRAGSLAGVAPKDKSSGQKEGYSRIVGGRSVVRTALFRAMLSACRWNLQIKPFYERLLLTGKKKMVALMACARKFIVIINAKIRDAFAARKLVPSLQEIMP
jgi:transposase